MRRPLDVMFRPIDRWPGERTTNPQRSRFKTGWGDTLELLKKELNHLQADSIVVMLDLTEDDIRLDGWPRANARPGHPGVVLAFDSPYGPLKYPCDTFTTWQDNLRAIALALEALRKVDRYGVTKRGEQYTGWRALPGGGESSSTMTAEAAAAFLARACGNATVPGSALLEHAYLVPAAYRAAARRFHPDAGGSTEDFQRLQTAKAVLDAHHGGRP